MSAKFATVTALRDSIVTGIAHEYRERMFHKIPELEVVKDRGAYLIEKAKDKVILDIGCTGDISKQMKEVAKGYYGFDKVAGEDIEAVDLDFAPNKMPVHQVDLIVCAEVIEHLSNPGWFLLSLKKSYPQHPVIFTVPNAGAYTVRDGCEVVNGEHVAWYSYQTLKALLTRFKYEIAGAAWYNGQPYKAEGIIMVTQT